MRESIGEFLSASGHKVRTAGSGEEALQIVSQNQESIDVLITDIEMPRMDGIELWKRLQGSLPNADVIFLSGHAAEIFEKDRLLPGEVLTKPPDLAKLEELLQKILGKISH